MALFDPVRAADLAVADEAPPAPLFSAAERRVIALARTEGLAALEPPGRLGRTLRALFGLPAAGQPLADPRLEALRRAIIVTRHRHHLPDAHAAELRRLGFSAAQVGAVEACAAAREG